MTDRDELIRRFQHTQWMIGQVTDIETIQRLTQLSGDLKGDLAKADKLSLGRRSI
jgi:hypothetical protein